MSSKRKRPGPKLSGFITASFRLPPELLDEIDAEVKRVACAGGVGRLDRSAVIRQLLREALDARAAGEGK